MSSDIRDDGRFYETSSESDLNDESTSRPENLFLQPSSISIDFDNINMPDGSAAETSNVADRVRKVIDFMSTVNLDLTGFLDALSWGDRSCFNDPKIQYARSTLLKSERLPHLLLPRAHVSWSPCMPTICKTVSASTPSQVTLG